MAKESPQHIPVDPTSDVAEQQLAAASSQEAEAATPATAAAGSVQQERSGAVGRSAEPAPAAHESTGPAFRRRPAEPGDD